MKLVLCAIAAKYVHCTPAPYALAAAVAAYAGSPVDCKILEHTVNAPDARLLEALYRHQPDVVGFGCYIWNMTAVERIVRALRCILPHVVILLGGPEVSHCPRQVRERLPEADSILCGEGEESLPRLLDALALGETPPDIVEAAPLQADPPSPWNAAALSALGGRMAYLETSRGCPFSCAFCLSGRQDGVRFFPEERARRELLLLGNSGSRTVKLVDRTFNCDPRRARDLWAFLIDSRRSGAVPPGVCFHFEIAADLLDGDTLTLLETAPDGLFQFEAGIQSFDAATLAAVSRVTDTQRLEQNLCRLMEMGNIHLHVDLIAGLPGEGLGGFADSFDRAFALRPHALQLGFLKLLHGSRLRAQAEQLGIVYNPNPPYEVLSTPWLGYDELLTLGVAEDALERLYNSCRFRGTVDYVLTASAQRPFDFFVGMGGYARIRTDLGGCSLSDYAALLQAYSLTLSGVEGERLRDEMVLDCLATDNTGRLPPCLHRRDPALREELRRLNQHPDYAARGWVEAAAAGRLGAALLYGGENRRLVVADHRRPHPVSRRYPLFLYSTAEEPSRAEKE